jgi:prepilin-type N-terminal cleavage/methylation domain-containing protein
LRRIWNGFTLAELLIVLIIIGTLASLGIGQFIGAREQAILQEAKVYLKIIASAEKNFQVELDSFKNYSTTAEINSNMRLSLPLDNPNWNYKVDGATADVFIAKARRLKDGSVWCFNQNSAEAYQNAGCVW